MTNKLLNKVCTCACHGEIVILKKVLVKIIIENSKKLIFPNYI